MKTILKLKTTVCVDLSNTVNIVSKCKFASFEGTDEIEQGGEKEASTFFFASLPLRTLNSFESFGNWNYFQISQRDIAY